MKKKFSRFRNCSANRIPVNVVTVLLLMISSAFSVTRTWDGGGSNANWSTPQNWAGDVAPAANDDVIFDATAEPCSLIASPATLISITFSSGYTGTFSFTTSTLTLSGSADFRSGGVIQRGTGSVVLTSTSNQTFYPHSTDTLPTIVVNLKSNRTLTLSTNNLNCSSLNLQGGTLNLGAGLSHSTSFVSGAGNLTFSTSTLQVSGSPCDFSALGALTSNTGTLSFTSNSVAQLFSPKSGTTHPNILHTGTDTLRLNGAALSALSFNQSGGCLDFNGQNLTTTGAGNFTITGGGPGSISGLAGRTLTIGGAASLSGTAGNKLNLNPAGAWTLAVTGALTAWYADIANSNASVSAGTANNSTNNGGNANWTFSSVKAWDGGAGDGLWSSALNWSDDQAPVNTDTVRFNTALTGNCQLNIHDTVATIIFTGGYNGTFDFGSETLAITSIADFRSGGAITAGSGGLMFIGATAHTFTPASGATPVAIIQNGSGGTTLATNPLNAGNLAIESGTLNLGTALTHAVGSVSGSGTLDFGTSNLRATGASVNFWSFAGLTIGTATLELTGSSPQTLTPKPGVSFYNLTQNGSGGTTLATNNLSVTNLLTVTQGVLNLGNGLAHSVGSLIGTAGAGTLDFGSCSLSVTTGNADFQNLPVNPGTGVLAFTLATGNQLLYPRANDTLPNLVVTMGATRTLTLSTNALNAGNLAVQSGTLALGAAFTHSVGSVSGSGNINFGGSTLQASGSSVNFSSFATITVGTGTLALTGSSVQTLTPKAGGSLYKVTQNGSGGTTVSTNGLALSNLLTVTQGVFNLGTGLSHSTPSVIGTAGAGTLAFGSCSLTVTNGGADFRNLPVDAGTGILVLTGGNQTFYPRANDTFPAVSIAITSVRTATLSTNGLNCSALYLQSGTLNLGTGLTHRVSSVSGSGNLAFNTGTLQVSGSPCDFSALGTLTPNTGTLSFTSNSVAQLFSPKSGTTHPNILHPGTDTLRLNGAALSALSLNQSAGCLDFNGQNLTTTGTGNFTITNGGSGTIFGLAGRTLTIGGTASLSGTAGNKLNLNPAGAWTLAVTGTLTAWYASIANSNASGSAGIAYNGTNGGGNTNWNFSSNKVWDGGAGDGLWGSALNWDDDILPVSTDTILFNTALTGNCLLNIRDTVAAIIFSAGYTQAFSFGSETLAVRNNADFRSGGSITAGTGGLTFIGTAAQQFTPKAGATLPAIIQNGSGGTTLVTNPLSAGDLTIQSGTLNLGAALTHTVGSVSGAGTLNFGTSNLQAAGITVHFASMAGITIGTTTLGLVGTSPQTLTPKPGVSFYNLTQNGSGGTTLSTNNLSATNLLTVTQGVLNLGSGLVHSVGSLTGTAGAGTLAFGSCSLKVTSGNADFRNLPVNEGTGVLVLNLTTGNQILYPRANDTLPSVAVMMGAAQTTTLSTNGLVAASLAIQSGTLNLGTGLTHKTASLSGAGNLTFSNSTLQVSGSPCNFSALGTLTANTGTLNFTSNSGLQLFSPKAATTHPNIQHTGSDTLRLSGAALSALSFSQSAGTLDFNSQNITVTGAFTITNGGSGSIAGLSNRTITAGGAASLTGTSGNKLNLDPGSPWTIAVTGALTAAFATIANSNASVSTGTASNSTNEYGNTNWNFILNKSWDGGAGDGLWSSAANWSDDQVPANIDTAIFNTSPAGNCQLDIADTVARILFTAGYTGSFAFGSETLAVTNIADLRSGGAVTAATGGLIFIGTSAQTFIPRSASTPIGIIQNGSGGTTVSTNAMNAAYLVIESGALNLGAAMTHTVGSVSGNGAIDFGTSNLRATGTAVNFGSLTGMTVGTATLELTGSSPQNLTPKAGTSFHNLTQNGSGGTTVLTNSLTLTNLLTVTQGIFNLGSGLSHSTPAVSGTAGAGTLAFGSCSLTVTNGGADFRNLPVNAGTGVLALTGGNQAFYPRANDTFPSVSIIITGNRTLTLTTNGLNCSTLDIRSGTLDLGTGLTHKASSVSGSGNLAFNTSTLQVSGSPCDFSALGTLTANSGALAFTSNSVAQLFFPKTGTTHPNILHSGSDTLRLNGSALTANSFNQSAGCLDFNTQNITTTGTGDFTITNGGSGSIAGLGGRTITVGGNAALDGALLNKLNLNPGGAWTIAVSGSLAASYANIANSNASVSAGLSVNGIDGGGNTNWTFVSNKSWDGGAGDGLWSSAQNWSDDLVPVNTDSVFFNISPTGNCVLDINDTVVYIEFSAGYTETFSFGSKTLSVQYDADFRTGGPITAGTGGLAFIGATAQQFIPKPGAVFPAIIQNGSGGTTLATHPLIAGDLTIESGTLNLGAAMIHTVGSISGSGTLDFGTSSLQATGTSLNIASLSGFAIGTNTLSLTGASAQTLIPKPGVSFYNLIQNGAGGTTLSISNLAVTNLLTVTQGIFNLGSGLAHSVASLTGTAGAGTLAFGSCSLTVTNGGADFRNLPVSAGTGVLALTGGNQTFYPRANDTFPAVSIMITGLQTATLSTNNLNCSDLDIQSGTLDLGAGLTHTASSVSGTGNLAFNTSTLQVSGSPCDFSALGSLTSNTGTLSFVSNAVAQLFTPKSGATHPAILHTGTGTLRLNGAPLSALSFSQSAGTLDFNGQDLTITGTGNFTITGGGSGTITGLSGRTLTVGGSASFSGSPGNELNLNPASSWTVASTGALTASLAAIANSNASLSAGVATNCTDGGGNTNWGFGFTLDSLMVKTEDLMPLDTLGEGEQSVGALRLILTHPSPAANTHKINSLRFTMIPANPSTAIATKILRRKGAATDLFSSTAIGSSSPLIFDLSASPLYLAPGATDTIDVRFDVAASPSASQIRFTLSNESGIRVRDSLDNDSIAVKGDGAPFPMASATGNIATSTATPSGKEPDGAVTDWDDTDERIETRLGADGFYATWDNSNVYFCWSGRDIGSSGVLLLQFDTGSGGSSTTYNYGSYGVHNLASGFGGADFAFYFSDGSTKGLAAWNGSAYAALTFTGEVTSSAAGTEVRIPLSDLGSPSTLKVIPYVQQKTTAEIVASMPYDRVSEFVRNPTGLPAQTFIAWYSLPVSTLGTTPVSATTQANASMATPTWSYDLGTNCFASSISAGYNCVYISVGGASPRLLSLTAATGDSLWTAAFASAPTGVSTYYETSSGKDVLMFCVGSQFHAGYDNLTSYSDFGPAYTLGGTGGAPLRSIPPDGDMNATVYAYMPCGDGKLYKINAKTRGLVWATADYNLNPLAGLSIQSTKIIAGCTDGEIRSFDVSGNPVNNYSAVDSVNNKVTYASSSILFAAPKNRNLLALNSNLTLKWSFDMGDTIWGGPFYLPTTNPAQLLVPWGGNISLVQDKTTTAQKNWTYATTAKITSDPLTLGSYGLFSSSDKRNFQVNINTGAIRSGWPTAVLSGANPSRVVADNLTGSAYFGGGDSKIYRYPKN